MTSLVFTVMEMTLHIITLFPPKAVTLSNQHKVPCILSTVCLYDPTAIGEISLEPMLTGADNQAPIRHVIVNTWGARSAN